MIDQMRRVLQKNKHFFYPMAILFTIGLLPLLLYDKVTLLIMIKKWHHPIIDVFTCMITHIGNGLSYLCFAVAIMLSGMSCRRVMTIMGSFACMSFIVQILLKHMFFAHILRPIEVIPVDQLHIVHNVKLERGYSFPSGHAATIFVLISVIQLLSGNKSHLYSYLRLLLAIAVAYSRVYLCQHFYIDVYIGAWVGTLSASIVYLFMEYCHHKQLYNWLDYSIYDLVHNNHRRRNIPNH